MSSTREDEAKTSYVKNAEYDEAIELGESSNSILSTATSGAGRPDASKPAGDYRKDEDTKEIKNAQYDEALELSDTQSSVNTVDGGAGGAAPGRLSVAGGAGGVNPVLNQNYDEALELSSDTTTTVDTAVAEGAAVGRSKPDKMKEISESSSMSDSSSNLSDSEDSDFSANDKPLDKPKADPKPVAKIQPLQPRRPQNAEAPKQSKAQWQPKKDGFGQSSSSSSDSDSDSEFETEGKTAEPQKYNNLGVNNEITKLFEYIKAFKPTQHDLDSKIKCFIPEFLPSIGDMDPFLKVHRPDGKNDELGLKILDEPNAHQSERTVLELQLHAQSKRTGMKGITISSIPNAEKSPAAIKAWIDSMATLHMDKPLPDVTYKKPMPDIETLMQVWPSEFEEALNGMSLPEADIDLSLAEYASILCALLDVPIHGSIVQSLHVLFTLFAEFKANQHFQAKPDEGADGGQMLKLDSSADTPKGGSDSDDEYLM